MKSYEQMTEAVLLRAGVMKAAQKRRRRTIAVTATCLCLALVAVFAGAKPKNNGGVKSRVSLFCITASADVQPQQMLKGQTVPYNAELRIRDITGLSDLEVQRMHDEDKKYAASLSAENLEKQGKLNWSVTSWKTDKILATTIYAGSFYLTVDDYEGIKDISVATTKIGDYGINGVDHYDEALKDGVGITWYLSAEGVDMIENDPQMKLSQITDTVTVTVEFTDGTTETVTIDITVDDAGKIYGTFQGTTVA